MGIVHEALHRNENVTGIDVVEWDPKILQTYKNCDCVVTLGDWREVLPPGPYRTIVFDASVRPMPLKDLEPLARLLIGEKDNVLRWIRPPGACRGQVEIISRWSLLHG